MTFVEAVGLPPAPNDFEWASTHTTTLCHLVEHGEVESICHTTTMGQLDTDKGRGFVACKQCMASARRAEPRIECTFCDTPSRHYRVTNLPYRVDGLLCQTMVFMCTGCYGRARDGSLKIDAQVLDLPEGAVLENSHAS